ncbi:hypothetical protein CP157_04036 (plasmid) [Paracoccus marcusii]|uniref:hypothetical protein n=1 Tax=Paracoccus marcusii TaxID=59779 RepID=UPI001C3E7168|nr:hypothetical protein [Paracoccus marcusii]QXI66244.1 hypothetical protein CP157_04036 [Paracoccus marcusii]
MTGIWLTYADAAALLGIKLDSVKRRARARQWNRRTKNDGIVEVCIPEDALPDLRPDNPLNIPDAIRPNDPPLNALRDRAEAAEKEAAAQAARAAALADQVADLRIERDRLLTIIERHTLQTRPFWSRLFRR